MAEALSIAASIAGLISLCDIVFRAAFKFSRSAKHFKEEITAISDELNSLSAELRTLEALASSLEAEGDNFDTTFRRGSLDLCKETLSRAELRMTDFKSIQNSGLNISKPCHIAQRIKWPFSKLETQELLNDICRHRQSISLALSANSLHIISHVTDVITRVDINTKILVDDARRRVLDYFMPLNPQSRLETNVVLRHSGTGIWLTDCSAMKQWFNVSGGKLWLNGIPGAGKTILTGAVVQKALEWADPTSDAAVGFFFCDYKDPSTWTPVHVLGALAVQLALQKEEAFEILTSYYNDLHPSKGLSKTPDATELRAILTKITEKLSRCFIIVDGIDECGDYTEEVVELLFQLATYTPRLSACFFSRDHQNIRIWFDSFTHIPVEAHEEDIKPFVSAELDRRIRTGQLSLNSNSMKEEISNTLVKKAKGMFRWVVCQIDYLCDCVNDAHKLEALEELPPDLPETYRRLLLRCPVRVKKLVKMSLSFIAFAETRLSIKELCKAVSTPENIGAALNDSNTVSEEEISRRCSSLIRKSENGDYFELAHFTVREFRTDKQALKTTSNDSSLEYFHLEETKSLSCLSSQCLRFLQLQNFCHPLSGDFKKDMSLLQCRVDQYPFYRYSALHWLHLTRKGFHDELTLELAMSLFHPTDSIYLPAWAMLLFTHIPHYEIEERRFWGHFYKIIDNAQTRSFHFAAAFNIPEICERLLKKGRSVNLSLGDLGLLDLAAGTFFAIGGSSYFKLHCIRRPGDHGNRYIPNQMAQRILPTNDRRNKTLRYLISKGERASKNYNTSCTDGRSPFSRAIMLCTHFHDFTAITCLLSARASPSTDDIFMFAKSLQISNWNPKYASKSSLELLKYLTRSELSVCDWKSQFASMIWGWALRNKIDYTEHFDLIGPELVESKELLCMKALEAVRQNRVNDLKKCLNDDRLEKDALHGSPGHTLLHEAVACDSRDVIECLLNYGCDPHRRNDEGEPPLHEVESGNHARYLMEQFENRGISLLSQNTHGHTLLHRWSIDRFDRQGALSNNLFNIMGEVSVKQTLGALLTKAKDGKTPIMLGLEDAASGEDFCDQAWKKRQRERIIDMILFPAKGFHFWDTHPPLIGLAAACGSVEILDALLEAEAPLDTVGPDHWSPLHQLGARVEEKFITKILPFYQDAVRIRSRGFLPVEHFIERCYKAKVEIASVHIVLQMLSAEQTLADFWKFLASLVTLTSTWYEYSEEEEHIMMLIRESEDDDEEDSEEGAFFSALVAFALENGAMKAYEDQNRQSGLIPIFKDIVAQKRQTWRHTYHFQPHVLLGAIEKTEYWESAKKSPLTLKFLKLAIHEEDEETVTLLLKNGVDPHARESRTSAIEYACQMAVSICNTDDGKKILAQLLDFSKSDRLKEFSPDTKGLGLLHRLATDENTSSLPWLMKKLVDRGVDPNGISHGPDPSSVLTYHVKLGSFKCAEALLDLGADPTIGPRKIEPDDVLFETVTKGNVSFLKKLRSFEKRRAFKIQWDRTWDFNIESVQGSREIANLNSLHLSARLGQVECASFFLRRNLIADINEPTSIGLTPMHYAAIHEEPSMVKILSSWGARLGVSDDNGDTPLHLAAKKGLVPVVQELINCGAEEALNYFGKSPRACAVELGHRGVVERLEQRFGSELAMPLTASRNRMKLLSHALFNAIREGDLAECKRLVRCGFPIDGPSSDCGSPKCRRCSPLIYALFERKAEIAIWLLECGALPTQAACQSAGYFAALEIVTHSQTLRHVLPVLFEKYLDEGGDLVNGDEFPLHHALLCAHFEIVEAVIYLIEKNHIRISSICQVSPNRVCSQIISRAGPGSLDSYRFNELGEAVAEESPLEIAVRGHSLETVSLLVEKGAMFNPSHSNGLTPPEYSNSEIFKYISTLGGLSREVLRCWPVQELIWIWEESFHDLFSELYANTQQGSPDFLTFQRGRQLWPTFCENVQLQPQDVSLLMRSSIDLVKEDGGGRSLMHCILCEEDSLRTALKLKEACDLQGTTPFPWHLNWWPIKKMAFLNSHFDILYDKIGLDFARILNLQPTRGLSPLCHAALLDDISIMKRCISMGAIIDFEGCPLGSALMIASACGNLAAVKFLVRAGASITFEGCQGSCSALLLSESIAVKEYLLVGQFCDRREIEGPTGQLGSGRVVYPKRGIVAYARLKLFGRRKMRPQESSLDYARRLTIIRKGWEGKVVPCSEGLVYPETLISPQMNIIGTLQSRL